jgi:hypothetical protein
VTQCAGPEVETLTIRILMRLQRRGRKLIMTPEGASAPKAKPRRDETLIRALVRAHRWRRRIETGQARSITDPLRAGGRHGRLRLSAPAADVSGTGHRGGDPGRPAAEGAQARRDVGEWTAGVGGAAERLELLRPCKGYGRVAGWAPKQPGCKKACVMPRPLRGREKLDWL